MANLNLKHATRPDKDKVEEYMQDNVEHRRAKAPIRANFPPMSDDDFKQLESNHKVEVFIELVKSKGVKVTAWRVNPKGKGFIVLRLHSTPNILEKRFDFEDEKGMYDIVESYFNGTHPDIVEIKAGDQTLWYDKEEDRKQREFYNKLQGIKDGVQ